MEKKNYIDYIVEETKKILAIDSPSGYTKEVAEYVLGEYRALEYEPKLTVKGGVLVALGGKNKEDAVMLEAHIDTLGAIVTEIKSNGRLKVSPIGGMNANNAEAENCRVATRFSGTFEGTCQLSNASVHVNGDYSDTKRSWDEMEIVLDEKADSREETEKLGRYLEEIQICGKELLSMLGNVLDLARIENEIPYCRLNGDRVKRVPNNINFSFQFVEGESLLIMLDMKGICASSGSACTSGSLDPSHVLLAIGLPHEIAHGSLRMSIGADTTKEDIDYTIDQLKEIVAHLRSMSPLYEDFMKKQQKNA